MRKTERATGAESKDTVVQPGTLRMERASLKPFSEGKNMVESGRQAPPVGRPRGWPKKTRPKPEFSVDRGRPSHGRRRARGRPRPQTVRLIAISLRKKSKSSSFTDSTFDNSHSQTTRLS